MKIAVFTSNAVRHKFVANTLAKHADEALIVSECKANDAPPEIIDRPLTPTEEHFFLRHKTEKEFFGGNDTFQAPVIPVLYKEANLPYIYEIVKKFNPDMAFVYGSCIIKEPLLSLPKPGRFINLHLGLSPYYRGAGTNFWPFINKELEYVGSTLLHIDAGVDTGDIISHVRPTIEKGDTVHTVGNKVIRDSAAALVRTIEIVKAGKELARIPQWKVSDERYYRKADFNEEVLSKYYYNMKTGLIESYLSQPQKELKIVNL